MTEYQTYNILLQILMCLCMLGIIFIALFSSYIKQKLFPVKLAVEVLDKNGELTILDNGHRVIYYHLRIINKSRVIVKNCQVFLTKINRLHNGEYLNVPFSVPLRYIWSPSESSPEGVDIVTERIHDFGYIIDSSTEFKPTVTPILNSFKGNMKHDETFRYYIEIIAENYRPKKPVCIQVTWDGIWPDDPGNMYQHLSISKACS